MKNTQAMSQMMDKIDAAYISDAERYEAIARAERGAYILEGITSLIKSVAHLAAKLKSSFASSPAQHA
ncbi:RSP_7527 family protein [Marinomonas algicola]|uniref:RSP_7527 family protein n=1 Tax=Marinomonas algicola TaxID=2773454 RepID=UPI00174D2AA2|nr:hypothetical protein [Marinomonas algicola]